MKGEQFYNSAGEVYQSGNGALWKQCNDFGKMASYFQEVLLKKFPDAKAEVYIRTNEHAARKAGPAPLAEMLDLFLKNCHLLKKPMVRFTPDHDYGLLCTVVTDTGKPNPADDSQSCVMLTLLHDGQKDILIGKNETPVLTHPACTDGAA